MESPFYDHHISLTLLNHRFVISLTPVPTKVVCRTSPKEKEHHIVLDCFNKIQYEIEQSIDKQSKTLITSNIELFLNYCTRFYDRQFMSRDNWKKGILEKFKDLLHVYFLAHKAQTIGLPSVAYCASELNLSSNYFGDLIKSEMGLTAQEYIHKKIIDLAK